MSAAWTDRADNRLVKRGRDGCEYLSVMFNLTTAPIYVALCRYCVPGWCDTYRFEAGPDQVIKFSSEWGNTALEPALKMLKKDLDRPQIVDLVRDMIAGRRPVRHIETMVRCLAPGSKVGLMLTRERKKRAAARKKKKMT